MKIENKKISQRIEELILILIILLNIFDFFELLSADLDFIKLIISWTVLGYLIYKASLTKIIKSDIKNFLRDCFLDTPQDGLLLIFSLCLCQIILILNFIKKFPHEFPYHMNFFFFRGSYPRLKKSY